MWIRFICAGILLAGCAKQAVVLEKPAAAAPRGLVGNILLVEELDQAGSDKVLVASFLFKPDRVEPRDIIVTYGAANPLNSDFHDFRFTLVDEHRRQLVTIEIWNPRKVVVEQQGIVEILEATYAVRFPFDPEAKEVWVLDSNGKLLASADVRSAIAAFCARVQQDPDCSRPK